MNIYQLEYFAAVVEEGTLQKAAGRLCVQKSTVSAAILTLEQELGHYLFRHSNAGLTLTEYGAKMYFQTTKVLREVAGFADITAEEDKRVAVRLAFQPGFGTYIVPKAVARFKTSYPHATVELNQRNLVLEGSSKVSVKDYTFLLSFAQGLSKSVSRKDKTAEEPLGETEYVALLHRASTLVGRGRLFRGDCDGKAILVPYGILDETKALLPNSPVSAFMPAGMRDYMKIEHDAVAIMPWLSAFDADVEGGTGEFTMRQIDFLPPKRTCAVFYDANRPMAAPEKLLLDLLCEEFAKASERVARLLENPAL